MNIENLKILRDHLRDNVIPAHFNMRKFRENGKDEFDWEAVTTPNDEGLLAPSHECGAVACALGHAAEVIPVPLEANIAHASTRLFESCIDFAGYCRMVFGFGLDSSEGDFLFSAQWSRIQDSDVQLVQAIRRLNYVLKHEGLPPGWGRGPEFYKWDFTLGADYD